MTPRVVVRFDESGEVTYYCEAGAELLIVDERTPDDRVYRWSTRVPAEFVDQMLAHDPVGHQFDGSEAAAKLGQHLN